MLCSRAQQQQSEKELMVGFPVHAVHSCSIPTSSSFRSRCFINQGHYSLSPCCSDILFSMANQPKHSSNTSLYPADSSLTDCFATVHKLSRNVTASTTDLEQLISPSVVERNVGTASREETEQREENVNSALDIMLWCLLRLCTLKYDCCSCLTSINGAFQHFSQNSNCVHIFVGFVSL